jgi:FkbM family methyltransferase
VSVGEMASVFSRVGKVEELVCFEPDPNQFGLTAEYLAMNHEQLARRVTAMPCAVYSHEAIEPFTYSDTSFGSRILASGTSWVQSVTIDHTLPGFDPTYIIMDIEGAEPEALKGAEKTIRACHPDLAVCVYHAPHHLWEIPLYLHGLRLGYRFYLRNYTSLTGETVLYATASP